MDTLYDVVGYEGLYKINKNGDVWVISQTKYKKSKFIKPITDKDGYYKIGLTSKEGKRKTLLLHRLLALQFIPNPDNLPVIDHIDRNKTNNTLENLRWTTIQKNTHNRPRMRDNTTIYKNIGIWFNAIKVGYWRLYIQSNGYVFIKYYRQDKTTLEEVVAFRNAKYIEFGLEICD